MFELDKIVRPNIRRLQAYSSARDEYKGEAKIWLDANENPFGDQLNRYPDPHQQQLKSAIADLKGVTADQVFLGNGSDEAIDLLFRVFAEPRQDCALLCPPTYGMYGVSAATNDVAIIEVPLTAQFQLDIPVIQSKIRTQSPKLIFVCSPNNPTANLIAKEQMADLLADFDGILVVDEAYIDFAEQGSMLPFLDQHPNLVVLQTFSKAWGLAGIRLGAAYASPEIIALLDKVKPPYNINLLTQQTAIKALSQQTQKTKWVEDIISERRKLASELARIEAVLHVFHSDANFLLVQFKDPQAVFLQLRAVGIIVRDRSSVAAGCLRITIGTPSENQALLQALLHFSDSPSTSPSKSSPC